MPPAAPIQVAFQAIADPRRRRLLELLAGLSRAAPVSELVKRVRRPQPSVSKDLAILRDAGLVSVTRQGRQRLYTFEGQAMRGVYEWVAQYERYWNHQVDRIKARAQANARRDPHHTTEPK